MHIEYMKLKFQFKMKYVIELPNYGVRITTNNAWHKFVLIKFVGGKLLSKTPIIKITL